MAPRCCRREFIGCAVASALFPVARGCLAGLTPRVGTHAPHNCTHPRVVSIHDSTAVHRGRIVREVAGELLRDAVKVVAGESDERAAWAKLICPQGDEAFTSQVVGVKVNAISGRRTCHVELLEAITVGLIEAGLPAGNIIIYDCSRDDLAAAQLPLSSERGAVRVISTDAPGVRYAEKEASFGTVSARVTRILTDYCSAVINVPALKTHPLMGVSLALKNHYGSVAEPWRFHGDAGDPAVADINALAPIRERSRVVVCDGLLSYAGGRLIVGTDPVACDAVGLRVIEAEKGSPVSPTPRWLATAAGADHRLGVADLSAVDLVQVQRG